MPNYDAPSPIFAKVINPVVVFLVERLGLSYQGVWVLVVRARNTGELKKVPVNLLIYQGARYLVSPRGETQWVRDLRAASAAELRRGNTIDKVLVAEDVAEAGRPPVLRAYLQKWDSQTKSIFGFDRAATDAQLVESAPRHPVIRLIPTV